MCAISSGLFQVNSSQSTVITFFPPILYTFVCVVPFLRSTRDDLILSNLYSFFLRLYYRYAGAELCQFVI